MALDDTLDQDHEGCVLEVQRDVGVVVGEQDVDLGPDEVVELEKPM